MRITPNYVAVEPWIWSDPRVRKLGLDARGLFGMLLTCRLMSKVPGLILHGAGALSDEWDGTVEEFRACFKHLEDAGLCSADWEARVVYVVPLLTEMVCNRPNGPSQAAAFGTVVFRLAPDCELTRRVNHDLMQLMLNSPALKESYLRCRPLSNEDARQQAERPIPSQPLQTALQFPETPQAVASEPAAGGESENCAHLSQPTEGAVETDSPPALRVVPDNEETELIEGLRQLVQEAGDALRLPKAGFTSNQQVNLRSQWHQCFEAGWRSKDLGDLGRFVAAGGLGWLTKKTPAEYLASMYLGDALARMDRARPKAPTPPPRRAGPSGSRLRWHMDRFGRPDEVDDGGAQRYRCLIGDAWELDKLAELYERYRQNESLTMADVYAAMASRPKVSDPPFTPLTAEELEHAHRVVREAG